MTETPEVDRPGANRLVVLGLVILAIFAGVFLARSVVRNPKDAVPTRPSGAAGTTSGASVTSVHNDAVVDYEAALKTGKPIYVFFHSLG